MKYLSVIPFFSLCMIIGLCVPGVAVMAEPDANQSAFQVDLSQKKNRQNIQEKRREFLRSMGIGEKNQHQVNAAQTGLKKNDPSVFTYPDFDESIDLLPSHPSLWVELDNPEQPDNVAKDLQAKGHSYFMSSFDKPTEKTLTATADKARIFISESAENLEVFQSLNSDNRKEIQEVTKQLSSDLDGLIAELKSTSDPEKSEQLRGEIRDLIKTKQVERRQLVTESISTRSLPSLSPMTDLVSRVSETADRLAKGGLDTSELTASISNFERALETAQEMVDQAEAAPSLEALSQVREQFKALKSLREGIRNQLESLLE